MTVVVGLDLAEIRAWIELAYPAAPGRVELLHVSSTVSWSGRAFLRDGPGWNADELSTYVDQLHQRNAQGIYLAACTLDLAASERIAAGGRGGSSDAAWCYGMWSDLDIDGPGRGHDPAKYQGRTLPPDEPAARLIVASSGLPDPTAWVHSGGGLYAWWLLDQPAPAQECAELSRHWQAALGRVAAAFGWHYGTGVSDLARVLRLPGTVNRKEGLARPCRILSTDGPRYSVGELRETAERITPKPAPKPAPAATRSVDPVSTRMAVPASALSPIDDFNARADWGGDILTPHGWLEHNRVDQATHWTRPGKDTGTSATTNALGSDTMKCFSDNAGLPTEGTMTKAFVWACLGQGTAQPDMTVAARELGRLGYGQAAPGSVAPQRELIAGILGTDAAEADGDGPPGPPPHPHYTLWDGGRWWNRATGDCWMPPATRKLTVTRASDIPMRAPRWLWEHTTADPFEQPARWLPLGGLVLLGGREGTGKTTWAYWIAAQITRGTLPGEFFGQPKSVVIAATEDDWSCTIVPRLMASGADLIRVFRVDVVEGGTVSGLSLPADVPELGKLCRAEDVVLIILDPLLGTVSTALDTNKDAEVRQALEPLSRLAAAGRLTIIGLMHANKTQGVDLLTKLMASRAFAAVARAVLYAAEEPPEYDEDGARIGSGAAYLLGQIKNNLAGRVGYAIRYHLEGVRVGVDPDDNRPVWSSQVIVDGTVAGRLDDLVNAAENMPKPGSAGGRAVAWLRRQLCDGPLAASVVKARAQVDGIAPATLTRAQRDLKVLSAPIVGAGNARTWSLPTSETDSFDQSDQSEVSDSSESSGFVESLHQIKRSTRGGFDSTLDALEGSDHKDGPAECVMCGQSLLLRQPGRDVCERCQPTLATGAAA